MTTFWLILTILALLWYSVVTCYVAVKGVSDVGRLIKGEGEDEEDDRR